MCVPMCPALANKSRCTAQGTGAMVVSCCVACFVGGPRGLGYGYRQTLVQFRGVRDAEKPRFQDMAMMLKTGINGESAGVFRPEPFRMAAPFCRTSGLK